MALLDLLLIRSSPILACPVCDTTTGRQVREGILSADFPFHLAGALLPFVVLTAIVAMIHFPPPWRIGRRRLSASNVLDPPGSTPEEPTR